MHVIKYACLMYSNNKNNNNNKKTAVSATEQRWYNLPLSTYVSLMHNNE